MATDLSCKERVERNFGPSWAREVSESRRLTSGVAARPSRALDAFAELVHLLREERSRHEQADGEEQHAAREPHQHRAAAALAALPRPLLLAAAAAARARRRIVVGAERVVCVLLGPVGCAGVAVTSYPGIIVRFCLSGHMAVL